MLVIWASPRENLTLLHANNKGADQPAYPHRLPNYVYQLYNHELRCNIFLFLYLWEFWWLTVLKSIKNAFLSQQGNTFVHNKGDKANRNSKILTKTAFKFDNKFYEQISGTTMGTKCAPSYAIIFMGKLENDFLSTVRQQPLIWWRYIDDIFMIWPHSYQELCFFLTALNSFHETI